MTSTNERFGKEIAGILGGERLLYCFQCGVCTGSCPSARFNSRLYNPRKIIMKSLLGMKKPVIEDKGLWLCMYCNSCEEFCPQAVRPASVLNAIKNIAANEMRSPQAFIENAKLLSATGRIATLMGANKLREKLSLNPIEELDSSDIIKIMKKIGFDKIIEKEVGT